jgi:deazaflavin-dependent oxidoreductase (nitroreductase family)
MMRRKDSGWQRALITGGSNGIGAGFARELAARGTELVLVARTVAPLEELASELRASHKVAVETLPADLTEMSDLERVEQRVARAERPVDLLINNAGSETEHGPFLERDRGRLSAEVELNVLATLRLTHAAAAAMASRGVGHIVNVSSGNSFYPTPGASAYGASKAFVNSFTEAVAHELSGSRVTVTAVCPGFTRTGAQARLGLNREAVPRMLWSEPVAVARVALKAAARGKVISTPGALGVLATLAGRHLPRRLLFALIVRANARLAAPARARMGSAGDRLAKVVRLASRPRPLTTRFTRQHAWVLRHSRGRLRRSWLFAAGQPVGSLTTTGQRTALLRSTAVAYFRDGNDFVVTATNLGNERDPAWCRNLDANPDATLVVDGQRVAVKARRADGEEADRLWARWLELQPAAAAFQRISGRQIPVFRLEPIQE